jgi:cytochrome c oxidase cbb3-type subunit 3
MSSHCHNFRDSRSTRSIPFYLLLLFVGVMLGCERESRKFHSDPNMSATPATTRNSDLFADKAPLINVGGSAPLVEMNWQRYERNAFNLSQGQWLYSQMNCGTCHAAGGGGDIGPTLTDDRWIYGYEPAQIFQSIAGGRPNGMPAFGPRMSQEQICQLTSYVRSLGGLVPKTIAPGREDNIQSAIPPNSTDPPRVEHPMPSPGTNEVPH